MLEREMLERMLDELRRLLAADDDEGARTALLRAAAITGSTTRSSNGEGDVPGADRRRGSHLTA
jgi:hypothetical protein